MDKSLQQNPSMPMGLEIEENHSEAPHWVRRRQGLDCWLLEFTLSGEGIVHCGSEKVVSSPGHLFLYPPYRPQEYGWSGEGRWCHFWAVFSPRAHWQDWLAWPGGEASESPGRLRVSGDDEAVLRGMVDEACVAYRHPGPHRWSYVMLALERFFLYVAERVLGQGKGPRDERIVTVCRWIADHLGAAPTLDELAVRANLSPSRFAHLFKAETGTSPQVYMEARKMEWACLRLRMSEEKVHRIAAELGYSSVHYFSRTFKKCLGVSPQHYRRRGENYGG